MPLFNRKLRRKKNSVGFKIKEQKKYMVVELNRREHGMQESPSLYGSYRSLLEAKNSLLKLVKEFQLCPKLCGLEQATTSCFSYQLKRCFGACIGEESPVLYNARLNNALNGLKQEQWPFKGSIAIKEQCMTNQLTHFLVFNQWRYLGMVQKEEDLSGFEEQQFQHDFDSYQIVQSYFKNHLKHEEIIEVDSNI